MEVLRLPDHTVKRARLTTIIVLILDLEHNDWAAVRDLIVRYYLADSVYLQKKIQTGPVQKEARTDVILPCIVEESSVAPKLAIVREPCVLVY